MKADMYEPTPPATPLLDLATLHAVHHVLHFKAKNQLEFDMYLHEQIYRSEHGREMTADEREIFLRGHFGLTEMPAFMQQPAESQTAVAGRG